MTTNAADLVAFTARTQVMNDEDVVPNGHRADGRGVDTIAALEIRRRPLPRSEKTLARGRLTCSLSGGAEAEGARHDKRD